MPSAADCATLQALADGVEAARKEAESVWGAERLPLLVDDAWRAKLHSQRAKWSAALQEAWASDVLTRSQLEAVEKHAAGMKRAWAKLADLASEAGHRPLHPDVWEVALPDGMVAALVRTNDEAAHVIATGRHLVVYTMAEIGNLIGTLVPESLQLAKVHFPGAQFQPSTPLPESPAGPWRKEGDEIPFPLPDRTEAAA